MAQRAKGINISHDNVIHKLFYILFLTAVSVVFERSAKASEIHTEFLLGKKI